MVNPSRMTPWRRLSQSRSGWWQRPRRPGRAGAEASWFDLVTLAGLWAFREAGVDWAVLEVGLGGRLDSTNVIDPPEVAVVTTIALEHTAILGDTLAAIAQEKGGIVKPGSRLVTGTPPGGEAHAVLAGIAEAQGVEHRVAWSEADRTFEEANVTVAPSGPRCPGTRPSGSQPSGSQPSGPRRPGNRGRAPHARGHRRRAAARAHGVVRLGLEPCAAGRGSRPWFPQNGLRRGPRRLGRPVGSGRGRARREGRGGATGAAVGGGLRARLRDHGARLRGPPPRDGGGGGRRLLGARGRGS